MSCFISYKKETGGIYANQLAKFMGKNKIEYFLDTKILPTKAGNFIAELTQGINSSDDFLLLLTPGALDSLSPGSVFLTEITTAIAFQKNIIPIIFGGFSFPTNLPAKLEVLQQLQGVIQTGAKICYDEILGLMTKTAAVERAFYKLTSFTYLKTRQEVEATHTLQERLSGEIKSISLCALACQGLLNAKRGYLEDVLKANPKCKIRVVTLNPNTGAAAEAAEHKICGATDEVAKNIIRNTYNVDMKTWCTKFPENFEGRQTDWYLPCAIFIVERQEKKKSTIKVDFYSFNTPDHERRCAFITATDIDNYEFYCNQFEYIWENAQPYIIDEEKTF